MNFAVDVDLCQYGAMDYLSMPVRGERILLTNFAPLMTKHKMCDHGHTHRPTHRADEVNRFGWPESMVEKVVEMMCSVNERGIEAIEGDGEALGEQDEEILDEQWHKCNRHTPYHPKCRTCVAAKARDSPHIRQDRPELL